MGKVTTSALLLTALALPIVLFWQLGAHSALSTVVAAAIAVAAGWALNVAWAFATTKTIGETGVRELRERPGSENNFSARVDGCGRYAERVMH